MIPRERALRAIYLEEPDIVPWFDAVDPRVLVGIFGEKMLERDLGALVKAHVKLGIDFIAGGSIFDPAHNIKLDDTHYVNEWGRIHSTQRLGDISEGYIGGYLDTPEKWDSFGFAPQ